MKAKMREQRDAQVKEICEKLNEEHFRVIAELREQLRLTERERYKLVKQTHDL